MEQQHKILFTGLTGNLGRALIPLLKKNNYIVYTTYKYHKELDLIGEKDLEFIQLLLWINELMLRPLKSFKEYTLVNITQ